MGVNKIKVLVVDDSALVRQSLISVFENSKEIEVIGTASDPYVAVSKIQKELPDVITLDVEMPRMDGLTFLRKIMSQHPIPTIIISSLTEKGTSTAIKALELGAVEVISKPRMHTVEFFEEYKIKITEAVKTAAQAKVRRRGKRDQEISPKYSADAVISKRNLKSMIKTTEKIVAIGASTGGTEAILKILKELPYDSPGIVVVQHMPEEFTRSFAIRLNELCKINVKQAENNDSVIRGRALIAPGNHHLLLRRSGARYYVQINEGPHVNRHRPSVDVLFRSTAQYAGKNSVGILLTGMGADGAIGLHEMREVGAHTVAQDEKTSVVFGMPKEAIKLGAAKQILPLHQVTNSIIKYSGLHF